MLWLELRRCGLQLAQLGARKETCHAACSIRALFGGPPYMSLVVRTALSLLHYAAVHVPDCLLHGRGFEGGS